MQTGWTWDAEFIGFFIADSLALFADFGVEVEFLEGGPNVDPERVLLEGGADVAISVPDSVAKRVAAGAELRVVGRQYRRDPLAFVVPARVGTAILDLAGATIFVPEVSRVRTKGALREAGLDESDYVLADYALRPAKLASDEIVAVVGYATTLPEELAADEPLAVLMIDSDDRPAVQNVISTTLRVHDDREEDIERFLAASSLGWELNGVDPMRYPTEFRSTWFASLERPLEAECRHNTRQLEYLATNMNLDEAAIEALVRTGDLHGVRTRAWLGGA